MKNPLMWVLLYLAVSMESYEILEILKPIRTGKVTVRCKECSLIETRSLRHFDLSSPTFSCRKCRYNKKFVPNILERGWKYVYGEIQSQKSKISCECLKCGSKYNKTVQEFMTAGCLSCQRASITKHTEESLGETARTRNHTLISIDRTDRFNPRAKLRCNVDKSEWDTNIYQYLGNKNGCMTCHRNKNRIDIRFVEGVLDEGYVLLNYCLPLSYRGKMKIACPKGHVYVTGIGYYHFSKHRCQRCAKEKFTSSQEYEIASSIKSNYTVIRNYWEFGFELDIYLPEVRVAIECNYWHSVERDPSNRYRHQRKYLKCKNLGILLIQVFEEEWKNRRQEVISLINGVIGGGLISPKGDVVVQQNHRPIYDLTGYRQISISQPEIVYRSKHHTVYDAGRTTYTKVF